MPIKNIRNYQRRSFDFMAALSEIGRNGDFSRIPGLRKKYKSHRTTEMVRLGLASEPQVRNREAYGTIEIARRTNVPRVVPGTGR